MRKKWLMVLLPLVCLMALLMVFLRQPATSFQVSDQADAYLVTTKGIYTFRQDNGRLELLKNQRARIAEYVYYFFPRSRLDNRYLVFTKGWDYPQSYPIAAVSLDFDTGRIQQHRTDYFATTGAGQSKDYYYTWQSDIEKARLTQFDKNGREIQSATYDGILLAATGFTSDQPGTLQLTATRDWKDGHFHSHLLTIDETDLSLLSEEVVYEPDNQHYRFSDSLVENKTLYTPVHSIRDMVSKEVSLSNQLLTTNLDTGEQEFLTLPEYAPELSTRQGDYLIIEHDPTSTQKVGFSLVNTATRDMSFINVSETLAKDLELSGRSLQFFSLDKYGRLLFMAENELIYMDIDQEAVLDRFPLADGEEAIYIWTVN